MLSRTLQLSIQVLFTVVCQQVKALPIEIRNTLICSPATWQTVVAFFIGNYGAHVLTVKSVPGDTLLKSLLRILAAIVLPYSGVWRGCRAIAEGKRFGETDLHHAARVGALCMLVRTESWRPIPGEKIVGCRAIGVTSKRVREKMRTRIQVDSSYNPVDSMAVSVTSISLHGEIGPLPEGYMIQKVPCNVLVTSRHVNLKTDLTHSYSILGAVGAIIQIAFAVVTLYRTRGDQVQRFGYAAYGLTVISYAIMSIINLIGNAMTPDYSSIYMVWSEVMAEAEARGGRFDGTVGMIDPGAVDNKYIHELEFVPEDNEDHPDGSNSKLQEKNNCVATVTFLDPGNIQRQPDTDIAVYSSSVSRMLDYYRPKPPPVTEPTIAVSDIGRFSQIPTSKGTTVRRLFALCIAILAIVVPYVLIATLTQFQAKESTSLQRGFIMAWLAIGQLYGFGIRISIDYMLPIADLPNQLISVSEGILLILASAPAIGGLVMVAQMLKEDGSCDLA